MTRLTFLGTAGGRFATILQKRATGGIYLEDGVNIHLDPGPGALVKMLEQNLNPMNTDAILISHCHPDHYVDAEILIEAMTQGGTQNRGVVIGSESVISGNKRISPAISKYHLSMPNAVIEAKPFQSFTLEHLKISSTPTVHSDESALGFKISANGGLISYTGDTSLSRDVLESHKDARVLILSVTRPLDSRIPYHMCTTDAAVMVEYIKPELAIITHFGMKVLKENPELQAEWIWKKTGVKTISAFDNMKVELNEEIDVQ